MCAAASGGAAVTVHRGRGMDATALELVLDREADAVPRARRVTADALRDSPTEVLDDAELLVSELVTNALLHGAPPIVLRLPTGPDRLRIEVHDTGRDMPIRMRDNADAMTGRGLSLVAQLASGWGVDRVD